MATKRSTSDDGEGSPKRSRIEPCNEGGEVAELPIRPAEIQNEQTSGTVVSDASPLRTNPEDRERHEVNGGRSESIPSVRSGSVPAVSSRKAPAVTSMRAPAVVSIPLESGASESKGSRHSMEDKWVMLQDGWGGRGAAVRCAVPLLRHVNQLL